MGARYLTDQEPPGQRMAFWLETVCTQILPVKIDLRNDRIPKAGMSCSTIGALRVRDVVGGGDHVYTRATPDIRQGDPETVQIGMPLKGSSILVQDGREAVLNAGDLVVYDSSRPFTLVMQDQFRWQVFLLPKAKLQRSERELRQITALPFSSQASVSRVVAQYLHVLAAEASALENTPGATALGESAADLISTLVRAHFGVPWGVADRDSVLRTQVLDYLDRNHGDVDLTTEHVAAAHGISGRRLHGLFEATGASVGERLRDIRLAAIRRDLVDPRLAHRSVARIAAAHGLRNPSAFTRLFRTTEGVTPREYRIAALGLP